MFLYYPEIIFEKVKNGFSLSKNNMKNENFADIIRESNNIILAEKSYENKEIENLNKVNYHLVNCYDDEFKLNKRIRKKDNHIYICKNTFVNMLDFEIQYIKNAINIINESRTKNENVKIYKNSSIYDEDIDDLKFNTLERIKKYFSRKNNLENNTDNDSFNSINNDKKEVNICNVIKTCSESIRLSSSYRNRFYNDNNTNFKELDELKILKCSIQEVYEINTSIRKTNKSNISKMVNDKNKVTTIDYNEIKEYVKDNLSKCKTI